MQSKKIQLVFTPRLLICLRRNSLHLLSKFSKDRDAFFKFKFGWVLNKIISQVFSYCFDFFQFLIESRYTINSAFEECTILFLYVFWSIINLNRCIVHYYEKKSVDLYHFFSEYMMRFFVQANKAIYNILAMHTNFVL